MSSQKLFSDDKKQNEYDAQTCTTMVELRAEIDRLDRTIVELLGIRQGFMERAAHIKEHRNLVRDEKRIEDVVTKVMNHAHKVGAHPELVEKLYRDMIEWCINYEMGVFDTLKGDNE